MSTPAENPPSKRILFVDDDAIFLQTIEELFKLRSKGRWFVDVAENTARALATLQRNPVDLLVIDLQMPVVDGEQFLQLIHRKYPLLRKVVMSGFATSENRTSVLNNGAELFLEKPRTADGFETVFSTLDELVNLQPREGFRGLLRQVGLTDVLQMECLARSSSILEITTPVLRGLVYIKDGAIIHATAPSKIGIEAFNELLALRGGDFNLKPFSEPPERTIEGQWESLIMEAARQRDEAAQDQDEGRVPLSVAPVHRAEVVPLFPEALSSLQVVPLRFPNQISEFIVCSPQGDVLHQWQCPNIQARVKLLDLIFQKAALLGAELPLGQFDRLEISGLQNRFVACLKPDRRLFLVATTASGGNT